ncbi:MAG: Calvin cycle protein CP12 [Cyanobacteria bacterium P01_D01_bin.1]
MTSTTNVSTATPTIELQPLVSQTVTAEQVLSSISTYENRLKAALEHARRLTQMHGSQSTDVAIAWETVEELQTAQSRKLAQELAQSIQSCQSAFDLYCMENPEADECRSYDC